MPLPLPINTGRLSEPANGALVVKSDGIRDRVYFRRLVDTLIRDLLSERGPFEAQFTLVESDDNDDHEYHYSAQIVTYNASSEYATTADGVRIILDDLITFAV